MLFSNSDATNRNHSNSVLRKVGSRQGLIDSPLAGSPTQNQLAQLDLGPFD